MRKMSWIHSSRGAALVVLFALALAAVGTAGALSVSADGVPNETRVGESTTVTVTVEDPFVDNPNTWTLRGATELESVSWTVTVLQQGEQVSQETYGSQEFTQELNADNGGDTIRIKLMGTVPEVSNYTYEPHETYTLYSFDQIQGNSESELNTTAVRHYTNDSKSARQAIDEAAAAINETGGNAEAENTLNRSISAYNNGNFPNAESLAGDAQEQAEQAEQPQQQSQLLLYGAIGLVVLALVGGGIYYWQANQGPDTKLQ